MGVFCDVRNCFNSQRPSPVRSHRKCSLAFWGFPADGLPPGQGSREEHCANMPTCLLLFFSVFQGSVNVWKVIWNAEIKRAGELRSDSHYLSSDSSKREAQGDKGGLGRPWEAFSSAASWLAWSQIGLFLAVLCPSALARPPLWLCSGVRPQREEFLQDGARAGEMGPRTHSAVGSVTGPTEKGMRCHPPSTVANTNCWTSMDS